MPALTKPLTQEEMKAIADGEQLNIEKIVVHGTYKNGLTYVREYPMGADIFPTDGIAVSMILRYPDPLEEADTGMLQ